MGIEEAGGIGVSGAGGIDGLGGPGLDKMEFIPGFDHGPLLAHLDHGYAAVAGKLFYRFPGLFFGEGLGFALVGKDYVHVILYQVVEEGTVGFHHVVGGHVYGDGAAGGFGKAGSLGDKFLVLDQIAFYVEVVVAFELLRAQVFRAQLQGGAHVIGEGALCVGAGDKHHAPAAGLGAVEHLRPDTVLLHGALEEVAKVIVAYLSQEAGRHAEDSRAGDGIGRTAAGNVLDAVVFEGFPDAVAGFHVHVLHAAKGQMVLTKEGVVREDRQDVREGIAYAKDGFHSR